MIINSKMFKIVSFKLCKAKLLRWSRKSFVTLYQYLLHPMPGCLTHKVYCGFADINIKILFQIKWLANWIAYLTNNSYLMNSYNSTNRNTSICFIEMLSKEFTSSTLNSRIKSLLYHNTKIPRNCIKLKLLFPKWVFPFLL